MATNRSGNTSKKSGSSRRKTQVNEPVAARALQSLILVVGVMLLFVVIFGGTFGPAMVGILIFASAFPPMRRHVDKWLVGKTRGDEANQAALIRMGLGLAIGILAITGIFTVG